MGGDDLGSSDDELQYLVEQPVAQQKRQHDSDDEAADDDEASDEPASKTSKKKHKQSPEQILLTAGRDLENQTVEQQASYLTTILRHYSLLTSAGEDSGDQREAQVEVLSKYCVKAHPPPDNSKPSASPLPLVDQIRSLVSNKKLKKWKHVQSPCILIVCQSARRAVEILKDVADCKVRIAKLFPKNASVSEQTQQLSTSAFPMAVGTPHRLLQLCRHPSGPLHLQHTQLVIIDCSLSNKMYTVLTLPDTAKHCAEWLREFVLPQIQKRNQCRLAFL
jgi:hypothetical protein